MAFTGDEPAGRLKRDSAVNQGGRRDTEEPLPATGASEEPRGNHPSPSLDDPVSHHQTRGLKLTGRDAVEGLDQGVNEVQDTVVVQGKGSRCQSQRGLTFALILIEETETQSSNVMPGGRAEDQSSP